MSSNYLLTVEYANGKVFETECDFVIRKTASLIYVLNDRKVFVCNGEIGMKQESHMRTKMMLLLKDEKGARIKTIYLKQVSNSINHKVFAVEHCKQYLLEHDNKPTHLVTLCRYLNSLNFNYVYSPCGVGKNLQKSGLFKKSFQDNYVSYQLIE